MRAEHLKLHCRRLELRSGKWGKMERGDRLVPYVLLRPLIPSTIAATMPMTATPDTA
jgi:hypothetical protein